METYTMSQKYLKDALALIPREMFPYRHNLFGLDTVETPALRVPKIELREDVPCTDVFRVEFNDWLIEMFGYDERCLMPLGVAYRFGNTVVVRPETAIMLASACA